MDDSRFFSGSGVTNWSERIHSMMDEMLQRHFCEFRTSGAWPPACNVYESTAAYHICFDLAGVVHDSVDVQCSGGHRIAISGHREDPRKVSQREALSVYSLEISEGQFRRVIDLPAAFDMDSVEATYDKGFLWIRLPKARSR